MHIEYEISERDYVAAQRLALKKLRPSLARMLVFGPWFGLFLLIFLVHAIATQGFSTNMLIGFVIPVWCLLLPILNSRSVRKVYAKSTNMHGPLSLDLDDAGLRFQGRTFASNVSWDHFTRFYQDKDSFVIFQQGQTVFNLLPKRCLSAEQIAALREILSRHIESGARGHSAAS